MTIEVNVPVLLLFTLLMSPYIHLMVMFLILFVDACIHKMKQIIGSLLNIMYDNWPVVLFVFLWIRSLL
jgi:hypothetical protein